MEDNHDKDPEINEIDEILKNAEEEIAKLQEQYDSIPYDKGPVLELRPPGMGSGRQYGEHAFQKMEIAKKSEEIRKDTLHAVNQKATGFEKNTRAQILEKAHSALFPDKQKEIDKQKESGDKEITKSQELAQDMIEHYKKEQQKTKDISNTPAKETDVKDMTADKGKSSYSSIGTTNFKTNELEEKRKSFAENRTDIQKKGPDLEKD